MSFWSLILEPGKKYEKEVENGIQVTRATLDTSQSSGNDGIVQVILDYEGKEMTVANLSVKHGIFQTTLDLAFKEGDRVAFSTSGAKLPVSLTGVAGLDDDEDLALEEEELGDSDEYTESLSSEDEAGAPELVPGSKKRKLEVAEKFRRPAKSAKLANGSHKTLLGLTEATFESEDEEDESYNPSADLSSMGEELLGEEEELEDEELDSDEDEDLDEEEEDDDDDEEDEDEEEEQALNSVQSKKTGKLNGVMETPKQKKKELAKQVEEQKSAKKEQKTPAKEGKTPKKSPPKTVGEAKTPSQDKSKTPKESKAVKALKAEGKETPKSEKKKLKEANKGTQQKQETGSPKKQMRSGGVMVEDVSLGTGEAAKKGSNVSMYYVGRLKSNNKVFDSQLSGPPLKFVLGRGEVIPGWDIGLVGMKVGGKRKLSIPSVMAYGKKGAPPEIPPHANLEFEVTMISCR